MIKRLGDICLTLSMVLGTAIFIGTLIGMGVFGVAWGFGLVEPVQMSSVYVRYIVGAAGGWAFLLGFGILCWLIGGGRP